MAALQNGDVGRRVFPTSHDVMATELLHSLLSVDETEGWAIIAAAMTDKLYKGLTDWFAASNKQRP
jgi:hypothetical protein